jgi:hypothetical protein
MFSVPWTRKGWCPTIVHAYKAARTSKERSNSCILVLLLFPRVHPVFDPLLFLSTLHLLALCLALCPLLSFFLIRNTFIMLAMGPSPSSSAHLLRLCVLTQSQARNLTALFTEICKRRNLSRAMHSTVLSFAREDTAMPRER